MAGSISDFLENAWLDHICNVSKTPTEHVYLALGTARTDSALTELSGNGYTREEITFAAASGRAIVQSGDVEFGPVTTTAWSAVDEWAIFDASTGGNMLAAGSFSAAKDCNVGRSPKVVSGEIQVSVSAGGLSTTWANNLLNRFFRNITSGTAKPSTYVALCASAPADADTDISAKEISGNNYSPVQVNVNGGSSPTWDLAASGVVDNTHEITFPTPSGTWAVTHMAIKETSTTGNLIFWADITDESCGSGDPVSFPAGSLDITVV